MPTTILNSLLPGQRIIKTAFAVSLSIYVLKILTEDTSLYFYAAIAAVMTVQNSMERSYRIGLTRILGTILGGGLAILFLYATKLIGIPVDNIIIIFIAITIAIKLCVLFNIKEGIIVCCILYLSSVSIQIDNNFILYVFYRLLATILGIVVALVINKISFNKSKLVNQ